MIQQHAFDMIFAIVNAGQETDLIQRARSAGTLGCTVTQCRGTVSNDMLDMLGLEDKHRCIVQIISMAKHTPQTLRTLYEHFKMHKAGHGIIFCVPLVRAKGVNAMFRLREEFRAKAGFDPLPVPTQSEAEEEPMNYQYELIYVIVKNGFADEVMDAAKKAGATGGTVIHARGIGVRESVKLFGVSIEPERDVLMIVAKTEQAAAIIDAVAEKTGLNMPGRGITFSLPIGSVMGITDTPLTEAE